MFGLFNKDKKGKREKAKQETSPGGSRIYQYADAGSGRIEAPAQAGVYMDEIVKHFEEFFGQQVTTVYHEIVSDLVHIDIHVMEATEKRDFTVIFTTGMSDKNMNMPDDMPYQDQKAFSHAELMMFLPSDWPLGGPGESITDDNIYWPVGITKFLARFPHQYNTWLGHGHTVPNGAQYEPFSEQTNLSCALLIGLKPELSSMTAKDRTPLNFYLVMPIYKEETDFKLQYGTDALLQLMQEKLGDLPLLLDIERPNVCAD